MIGQRPLGRALLGQNKLDEAEPLLLGGYQDMQKRTAQFRANVGKKLAEAAEPLAALYAAQKKAAEAEKWKQTAEQWRQKQAQGNPSPQPKQSSKKANE